MNDDNRSDDTPFTNYMDQPLYTPRELNRKETDALVTGLLTGFAVGWTVAIFAFAYRTARVVVLAA